MLLDSNVRIKKTLLSLEPYMPSESWITKFCHSKNITLKSPETIEEARRKYCNTLTINSFFTKHGTLLKSLAPHNIWNADESSSASQRKYKVLLNNQKDLPLINLKILIKISINKLFLKIDFCFANIFCFLR